VNVAERRLFVVQTEGTESVLVHMVRTPPGSLSASTIHDLTFQICTVGWSRKHATFLVSVGAEMHYPVQASSGSKHVAQTTCNYLGNMAYPVALYVSNLIQ
jgi:hypothetical protein